MPKHTTFYCVNSDCDWTSDTSDLSRLTENWLGGTWKCPLCREGVRLRLKKKATSTPSVTVGPPVTEKQAQRLRGNHEWLTDHADDPKYAGKWVALDGGRLVVACDTSEELIEAVDDPKKYLVTRLGPYDWEPKPVPPREPTPFETVDTGRRHADGRRIVKIRTRDTSGPHRFGNAERLGTLSLDDEKYALLKKILDNE